MDEGGHLIIVKTSFKGIIVICFTVDNPMREINTLSALLQGASEKIQGQVDFSGCLPNLASEFESKYRVLVS